MKQVMFVAAMVASLLMLSSTPVFSQGILEEHWKELEAKHGVKPRQEEKKESKPKSNKSVLGKEVWQWSAGVRGSAIFPRDKDVDTSLGLTGYVAHQFTEYLRAEIESGWIQSDVDVLGELHTFPLLLNGQITIPTRTGFTPYLTGGLGVLFFNFEESSLLESSAATIEIDPAFAMKVGGGFDYRLSDSTSINVDGGYVFSDSEAELKLNGATIDADDVDADYWLLGGGFRVSF